MACMEDKLAELLRSYRINFSVNEIEIGLTADNDLHAAYRDRDGVHHFLGVFPRVSPRESARTGLQLDGLVNLHVAKQLDGLTEVVHDHLKARGVRYTSAHVSRRMTLDNTGNSVLGGYMLTVRVDSTREVPAAWDYLPSIQEVTAALRDWSAPTAADQPATAQAPEPKVELGQVWLDMPSQRLFTVVDQPESASWDLSDGSEHVLETEQHLLTSPDWELPSPQRRCLVRKGPKGPVLTPELRAEIVQEELAHPPEGATAEAWRLVVLETAEPSDDHQVVHSRALIRALGYARIGIERYERARQRLLRYGK